MRGVAVAVLSAFAAVADAAPPRLAAQAITTPPRIDGRLDDAVWHDAPVAGSFVQKTPKPGTTPSEPTYVQVLYDREAIYIGFHCVQKKSAVIRRLTRRDRQIEADSVSVAIDSRADGTSAFDFTVSAAGVLIDMLRFNDTDANADWDELWEGKAALTDDGWSAELRIPLRILRFDHNAGAVQSWGLQLRRYISERRELDEWTPIPAEEAGEVSRYGRLTGLRLKPRPSPFELRPFLLGRVLRRDVTSTTLGEGWAIGGSAGGDLKWHITQNLTLDAAFNPDFGQVEADQAILNLTTYEFFFPEKRPFFQEGTDVFATPLIILYTRRIGLPPDVPVLPGSELTIDAPGPSTLYGALKLTGKLGNRVTLGLLSVLSARNTVDTRDAQTTHERIAQPLQLATALRLKIAVGPNAHIGLVATALDHFEATGRWPTVALSNGGSYALCPDGSAVAIGTRCTHDSYVGGVDFRWRSTNGRWTATGQALVSGVVGGPPRTLRDGTVVSDGDAGAGGIFRFAKEGGERWLFDAQYTGASQKLDYNGLGFMPRQAFHELRGGVIARTTDARLSTLMTSTRLEYVETDSLDFSRNLGRSLQLSSYLRMKSEWQVWVSVHWRPAYLDDREVLDGTALQRAQRFGAEAWWSSDPRRRVSGELWAMVQYIDDGINVAADGGFRVRAASQLDFELLPSAGYTDGEPRYIGASLTPGSQLFGRLRAAYAGATLRGTYTFLPTLTLQVYAQLFLDFTHYGEKLRFDPVGTRPQNALLAAMIPTPETPLINPDGENGVVNINVVLRWEYRPGSLLYVVYARAQSAGPALVPGVDGQLDFGAIRRSPASDTFLIKLSYWIG